MNKLLSRKEYEEYVRGLPKDYCPFCDLSRQIVLGESKYWYWVANISPYWKWHTLLIPKRHESDMDNLIEKESKDYRDFHKMIIKHLMKLGFYHDDGKIIDQFITMIRTRINNVSDGSTYYKPDHLHIHIVPDREGVSRFVIDDSAKDLDIQRLSLKNRFHIES